jgi:DNA-binding CsgD family transcriptional regulator
MDELSPQQRLAFERAAGLEGLLTEAEKHVLHLSVQGLCAKEIAVQVGKSRKAVEHLLGQITAKARGVYGGRERFRGKISSELYWYLYLLER